jgi:hypothetical protein
MTKKGSAEAADQQLQQQQQQVNIGFLTAKDLLMLEQARVSGDLKALQQHIAFLENALPSLRPFREHEADKTCLQRLPYLRQVLTFYS